MQVQNFTDAGKRKMPLNGKPTEIVTILLEKNRGGKNSSKV
jgi:hypothetical protein